MSQEIRGLIRVLMKNRKEERIMVIL